VIIDSIQTTYFPELDTAPGSVAQVRECTMRLMQWAKSSGVPTLITGHVTKDGTIAGPRVLEHIVDVVLYLEGRAFQLLPPAALCQKTGSARLTRVGVFEMKSRVGGGGESVPLFLSQRGSESIGSVVVPTLEGSRPLLVEIQR